jgi:hypothetical protein
VTDGKKMEGSCSTGQSPQWAVVPVEEEDRQHCKLRLGNVDSGLLLKKLLQL